MCDISLKYPFISPHLSSHPPFLSLKQHNVHPKVGLVTKEEFETQRGGEEGGREGEEGDGEMVFPLDLQEGAGGGGETEGHVEGEAPQREAAVQTPSVEKKGRFI